MERASEREERERREREMEGEWKALAVTIPG